MILFSIIAFITITCVLGLAYVACFCSVDDQIRKGLEDSKAGRVISMENLQKQWDIDDAWDKAHPVFHFIKQVYYTIRRFFYEIPSLPRYGFNKIKRGLQRGYRGWADQDVWALDHYLSKVIKESLIHLQKHKMGCPATDDTGDDEKDFDPARWHDILGEMIYAFDLNEQIANGYREGYYPQISAKDRKEMNCLTLKEDIRRRKGMLLFIKYYFSLWD